MKKNITILLLLLNSFFISQCYSQLSIAITSGSNPGCVGSTVVIQCTGSGSNWNLNWTINGTGAPTSSVFASGTMLTTLITSSPKVIRVSGGGFVSNTITLTAKPAPQTPGAILGLIIGCPGQNSVTYSVSPITNASSYLWTLPSAATGTSSTNSINVNYGTSPISGNITVKGVNSCGVSGLSSTLAVSINSIPNSAGVITGTTNVCPGQNSVTYSVTAITNASSYLWTLPSATTGTSSTNSININYGTSAVSGIITVKGYNTCGYGLASTMNITVNSSPTITVNSDAICVGQSFTMVPSGASTYTYSSGSAIVSPTANASYNVTGTDGNGCTSSAAAISNVTVNALPTVNVNSGAICAGQSFTMVPSGASTYTYSSGSAIVSPTANASYNLTGTDGNGCTSSASAISNVTVNALPTVNVNSGAICAGQSFTMVPSGAISYTYPGGTAVVSPTTNTTYTVSGANAEGCTTNAVAVVTVNPLPNVTLGSIQSPLCLNNSTVQLIGNPAGGVYSGTGVIGTSFNPAVAGAGTFTINYNYTDANTCSASASQSVDVSLCTGTLELNNESVSIYPNPASNMINVKMNTILINNATLELYDATGKLITQQKVVNDYSSLNLNGLANGIYTVRIITDNEQTIKRIVKQQ